MGNKNGRPAAVVGTPAGADGAVGAPGFGVGPPETFERAEAPKIINLRDNVRPQSGAFAEVPKARLYISTSPYTVLRAPDDLAFNVGELLEILNWDDDPNWWYARNDKGMNGYIPSSFVTNCESLETFPWYHGNISRYQTEQKLRGHKNGTFLIRESQQNKGDFTISLAMDEKIYHYRVRKINHTRFYLDDPNFTFKSLGHMIDYHSTNYGGLRGYLEYPCPKDPMKNEIYGTSDTKDKWELDKNEIELGSKLGSGQYGDVYKGKWRNMEVAVKQLKSLATGGNDWIKEFKMESGIMKKLQHPNLVQLLGVCTTSQPYYIVTELLVKKSLLDFLRSVEGRSNLDASALLNMSIQVCSAMVYLEEHKYIHRDLAARNCLVGADYTVKVADFGLSRLVSDGDNVYMASEGAKFPIKWTAPEALEYSRFTTMSDVWSYGILLWEISSLGKVPYPDTELADVITRIRSGYRLPCPSGCPNDIYRVMLQCWEYDAPQRPTFKAIKASLTQVQDEMSGETSILDMIQGRAGTPGSSPAMQPKHHKQPPATLSKPPVSKRWTKAKWLALCEQTRNQIHEVLRAGGAKEANDELTIIANEMLRVAIAVTEEYSKNISTAALSDVNEIIVYLTDHVAYTEKTIHLWTSAERVSALDNYFRVVSDTETTLATQLRWEE